MITGKLRIVAKSKEDAEEIAGYVHRATNGNASFFRATRSERAGEWICYGDVELPEDESTKARNG